MNQYLTVAVLSLFSLVAHAGHGTGKVMWVGMAGEEFTSHPNIAQFAIEGGFTREGCSSVYAGIRKKDDHLISALIAAKMGGSVVEVYLNINDQYYDIEGNNPDRCVVTAITIK
ncbi:hypothetical protein SAMN02745866_04344 [Alteromonadaceae bacterium Bs31]|nr:hypothetical protein SAMN02745866_04344 [Alteromonadaceae bacterium Bs31]